MMITLGKRASRNCKYKIDTTVNVLVPKKVVTTLEQDESSYSGLD